MTEEEKASRFFKACQDVIELLVDRDFDVRDGMGITLHIFAALGTCVSLSPREIGDLAATGAKAFARGIQQAAKSTIN